MEANLQTSTKRLSIGNFMRHKLWFERGGITLRGVISGILPTTAKIIMGTMQYTSQINRPLPSSKNPHFQNEATCTTFLVKMSFFFG